MKTILIEQNPHWDNALQNYVKREKLQTLIEYLPLKQIITISGIRRCGKSTLARQAINHLIENGVEAKNILFVNLEQPYFLEYKEDPNYLNEIYDAYVKLMDPKGKTYVVFDEVQFFTDWQVYVKSKYESSNIKFIITGSNSSMLSNDLNTLLSGRSLNIHLDTFSFKEFLDYKVIDHSSEHARIKNKIDIKRAVDEYITWGGFYEVFEIDNERVKKELLNSYVKNIIYQDIVPRYNIRNSQIVERLFFYLLSNATTILNYSALAKSFDISDKSVKEYINYFEDVFMLARIDKFHTKQKEKIKSSKKIYVLDNGFLQIAPKHSKNLGASLENMVFNKLTQSNEEVNYLRETYKVDFFSDEVMTQVSYDISNEKTKQRELKAFGYFKQNDKVKCEVVTYDVDESVDGVDIVSIDNYLLR